MPRRDSKRFLISMSDKFKDQPIWQRLLEGAKVLGQLWQKYKGCAKAWDVSEVCACLADQKPSPFCRARTRWLTLALEAGREVVDGEWGLFYSMTASEWDATGLTIKIELLDIGGVVAVGPAGAVTMRGLAQIAEKGGKEGLRGALKIIQSFEGSKIEVPELNKVSTTSETSYDQR
jgi:hypothetical protein